MLMQIKLVKKESKKCYHMVTNKSKEIEIGGNINGKSKNSENNSRKT